MIRLKLRKLIEEVIACEIADSWKGSRMADEYAEIEEELRIARSNLEAELVKFESLMEIVNE